MTNEMKVHLCEQYAQRLWTASLGLAQEAGRAGRLGRGYAVIADEARNFANKAFNYSTKLKFEGNDDNIYEEIKKTAVQLSYLFINSSLEVLRVEDVSEISSHNKAVSVLIDDLRNLAFLFDELVTGVRRSNKYIVPEVVAPVKSSNRQDYFIKFNIGGVPLVENAANVMEIYGWSPSSAVTETTVKIRKEELTLLKLHTKHNLTPTLTSTGFQPMLRIMGKKQFVVMIDDLDTDAVFQSKIGLATTPDAAHPFAEYSRECWDAVGGGQLVFLDWEKLA